MLLTVIKLGGHTFGVSPKFHIGRVRNNSGILAVKNPNVVLSNIFCFVLRPA